MAVLPILTWPDGRLTEPCLPVQGRDVSALAQDMLDTMYAAPGRGLAAPQVGYLLRLFVMDVTWKEGRPAPRVIIDPEILWRSDEVASGPEGCLSIPGMTAEISRHQSIRMAWTDLQGHRVEERLSDFAAICAQHEHDHLEGILTLDRLSPAMRQGIEAAYLGGLAQ